VPDYLKYKKTDKAVHKTPDNEDARSNGLKKEKILKIN
jgi:hypothetical protein